MVWALRNPLTCREPILRRTRKGCPIGVDMGSDSLKLAQLEVTRQEVTLVAADFAPRPEDVEAGSAAWQRWAIETISQLAADGDYRGRDVIAALPPSEISVEHIKLPNVDWDNLGGADAETISRIKQKLPFNCDDMIIRPVPTEQDNVVVIATRRQIIDRHLAIYEKAGLQIKSIAVWPDALVNIYARFFGRRESDAESIVMLICMETTGTNVVICRHKNLLFARSVAIGTNQLGTEEAMTRLSLELAACRQHFGTIHKAGEIDHLIFLLGSSESREICLAMAKQLQMPAQTADPLEAVKVPNASRGGIDRRQPHINWSVAFGLSLS
jgi:Tfp pilus assembly PilM family ATPase